MARDNRKQLIVNKEVQFDLLAFLGVSGASFFICQTALALIFYGQIRDILPFVTSEELISRYAIPFFVLQIIPLATTFIICTIYFNKLTNQIVGPIYKIKKTFEMALQTNEFQPIVLREGDYFKKEVDVINEYMNRKAG